MAQINSTFSTSSPPTSHYARLLAMLKRDPKKAGVLLVLAVVLGFMVMRSMSPDTPRRAQGSPARAAVNNGTRGGATGNSASTGNVADPRQAARDLATSAYLRKWAEVPVTPLSRNLFTVRLEYFPIEPGKGTGGNAKGMEEDGFWAKLEKSLALQADQRDKRENQIANYKAKAAQLKLQSTMMGPQPKALVNGELVGEGDVVADFFRVVRIEARRLIVEREGIRLEILMK